MSEFKIETHDKTSIIYLPARLTDKEAADFKSQVNGWLLNPVDSFVLDFKKTILVERPFYQAFLQFRSILKNNQKSVFSVNLSAEIHRQIKVDGLDAALSPVENITIAQKKSMSVQESKSKIDLEFIKPFLKGAKSAFETQCNTPIQPQKPYIKTAPVENIAIAAVLSLTSDNHASHPISTANMLRSKKFVLTPSVSELIEKHHERVDGKGFPGALSAHKIPLSAQLLAFSDWFECLMQPEPGQPKLTPIKATEIIQSRAGLSLELILKIKKFFLSLEEQQENKPKESDMSKAPL